MRMNSEDRRREKVEGRWGGREGGRGCREGSDSGIKVNSHALFMALSVKISFTCAVLTHCS